MAEKQYELQDVGIVHIIKRSNTRSIRMGFTSKGEVKVSIPSWMPFLAGYTFAKDRRDWILKHKPEKISLFQNGMRVGKAHRLHFEPSPEIKAATVRTRITQIIVRYPSNLQFDETSVQKAAERGAKKALLAEGERLLPGRLRDLAQTHGFSFRGVTVKQLTTRWGSCDQFRDIKLNYYLMQLPWHLIDYVLIHELTHTEHLNHSAEFWKRFEQALPGAKKIRTELKGYRTAVIPI